MQDRERSNTFNIFSFSFNSSFFLLLISFSFLLLIFLFLILLFLFLLLPPPPSPPSSPPPSPPSPPPISPPSPPPTSPTPRHYYHHCCRTKVFSNFLQSSALLVLPVFLRFCLNFHPAYPEFVSLPLAAILSTWLSTFYQFYA